MSYKIVIYLFAGLICQPLTAWTQVAAPADKKSVAISVEEVEDGRQIVAENSNPFSVTLTVDITGTNFATDTKIPVTVVLKGRESTELVVVSPKEKGKDMGFQIRSNWILGNINARHDDSYIYRLPFRNGQQFRVGQSYNGSFSHHGAQRYSVDFMMEEGTQVVAAREGVVMKIVEHYSEGGTDESFKDKANSVIIEHSDGTLAEYAHLKKNGALVERGKKVMKGQVIGLSGHTGYSSGPHLHFMVFKIRRDGSAESLPVKVETTRGIISNFQAGETYRP